MSRIGKAHPDWLAFHAFYHGDRDRMLGEMVAPLVKDLAQQGLVDRFFFIRYPLGGPHLRLRFRPSAEAGGRQDAAKHERIVGAVEDAASRFFDAHPSQPAQDEEEIRRDNELITRLDPAESDIEIYPNHSCHRFDFEPELERYGGPELLDASLDFFVVSSRRALDFVDSHGERPRSRQLPAMLCLLAGQAFGFARDADELLDLLAYPMEVLGGPDNRLEEHPLVAKGDRVFEAQSEIFGKLLASELEAMNAAEPAIGSASMVDAGPDAGRSLADGARWLSHAVAAADPARRRVIGSSQMHMTANRLGLTNPEELYLSRLMQRSAAHLMVNEPEAWEQYLAGLDSSPPDDTAPDSAEVAQSAEAESRLASHAQASLEAPTPETLLSPA